MSDKPLKAIRAGILNLGEYKTSCAIFENGTRVLVERSMANALGRRGGGAYWQRKKKGLHVQNGALLPATLMDASPNYPSFYRLLQRALPRIGETYPMDLPEE